MTKEQREKLYNLVDAVDDMQFELLSIKNEINKLHGYSEAITRELKEFMRETRVASQVTSNI